MPMRFESNIAGEVAYLGGTRDGAILLWSPGTTTVRFGFNRPGSSLTRVENPGRFGGAVHNRKEFRAFATRFREEGSPKDAAGADRKRAKHPRSRNARRTLSAELLRRREFAKKRRRNDYGQFV